MSKPIILLPVDGSEHAMRAAEYAIKIARQMDAHLRLVYCHRPFPVRLGEPYFQNAINQIMDRANTMLEPFRTMLKEKGAAFDDLVIEGPPGEKICEIARIEKCEMVIMGSRGRSDLKGLFLGSVAHRVLQQAPCPVLVVR
ncbi:universal stress protein [Desulfosarcina ovata subsp. sediminis]|uniref:Universal stress protein n=1 Tax=Desulfosarcina ovata subsp. sediminis TaxID=885957 RepID=A0A5K8A111_9BACT|nr:universal stress protein [Desulfosarcina ovata]BBO86074.1 universal stress protein [Desulfosarcina ovata subsp. sediminis]